MKTVLATLIFIATLLSPTSTHTAPAPWTLTWPQTIMSYGNVEYRVHEPGGQVVRYEIGEIKRSMKEER